MDSNPYRSRLNGLDWSATPIQSSHSIANTVQDVGQGVNYLINLSFILYLSRTPLHEDSISVHLPLLGNVRHEGLTRCLTIKGRDEVLLSLVRFDGDGTALT